jgi:two-component system, chemotaxis family, protein-glutamate methylesterase/glutaminase
MRTIRVVIVDGEPSARRRLGRAVEGCPDLDLVGAADFGMAAVEKVDRLHPDLVLLGVVDDPAGWETLVLLRHARPELPILVISPGARKGSPESIDAIHRGASGCIAVADLDDADLLLGALLPRVAALGGSEVHAREKPPAPSRSVPTAAAGGRIEAVVIGSSTGGPNGLAEVVRALPAEFPAPVLIVQHMPAQFVGALSERLDALRSIPVREAVDGEVARPGTAWVAPGGVHLELAREKGALRVRLVDGPPENSCRPSVDVLFRSAAQALGGHVLGVVLTGMGFDGLRGCRAIREAGGTVLVQDEATSVVWGMPGNVAQAGLAQKVLPIGELGAEIVRLTMSAPAGR